MANFADAPSCKACHSIKVSSLDISNLPISAQPFTNSPANTLSFHASLFLCEDCGHMFLDIPPVSYYKNVIRSVSVSPEMIAYRCEQFSSLASLFSKPASDIRVLEIGAGNGQYSSILSKFFPLCFATEPNSRDINVANVHFIDTHPDDSDFEQLMKRFGEFDFICCFNYLEHLPNPLNTLRLIEKLLAPDGYVLIEVPNCDHIRKEGLLSEVITDHLHYFTSRSLASLASVSYTHLRAHET